jgi:hypothetical protein
VSSPKSTTLTVRIPLELSEAIDRIAADGAPAARSRWVLGLLTAAVAASGRGVDPVTELEQFDSARHERLSRLREACAVDVPILVQCVLELRKQLDALGMHYPMASDVASPNTAGTIEAEMNSLTVALNRFQIVFADAIAWAKQEP